MRSGFGHLDEVNRLTVEDHCRNPRHAEPIADANASATIDNPFCGDLVTVEARVADGRIDAIAVLGSGCAITQASSSMMGEVAFGASLATVREANRIVRSMLTDGVTPEGTDADAIGDMIALQDVARFPVRIKCALLAWATLEDALATV